MKYDSGFTESRQILLWGDSLTEGSPGVAFTSFLYESISGIDWVNRGRGGDTALSLMRRLEQENVPDNSEKSALAILWVGVNDVFADLIPGYNLIKAAMRQPPTRNIDNFLEIYHSILEKMTSLTSRIIALPPLFVGENPSTELNLRLHDIGGRISAISSEYSECRFVDLRESLPLVTDNPPSFLPVNPWSKLAERFGQVEAEDYDRAAERRGLKWTYDGVHFNSRGARKVATVLSGVIREELEVSDHE